MNKGIMWLVCIFSVFAVVMFGIGRINDYRCLYPKTAQVVRTEFDTGKVLCVDGAGVLWEFYGDDYAAGDFVSLMMDSMGTETIYDDNIVSVRYAGIF